jgi:hypothetical protein
MSNPTVSAVFDGVNSVCNQANSIIDTGRAFANTAMSAFDSLSNISRRDFNYQMRPMTYQPTTYPWASQQYGSPYGQQQGITGYPGISNPNYGRPGYFGSGFINTSAFSQPQSQWNIPSWVEQSIWGS